MFDSRTMEQAREMAFSLCRQVIEQFKALCQQLSRLTGTRFFPRFIISGGDPLLHPNLLDILDLIRKDEDEVAPIEIMGNADLLDEHKAQILFDKGVRQFQVSLDGMEERHDQIRGKGSFNQTLKGLDILAHSGIDTHVMFTLFKENRDDLLPLMQLAAQQKVASFAFARLAAFGQAQELDSEMEPLEYRSLLLKVLQRQGQLQQQGYTTRFPFKDHLWNLLRFELGEYKLFPHRKPGKTVDGCHLGQTFLVLLPDGLGMACRRFYSPVGQFPQQSLSHIFLHSRSLAGYRKIKTLEKCSQCKLLYNCRGCPAVAHGVHGDWKKPDPQCWQEI